MGDSEITIARNYPDHVERPCEQIGETIAFDRAVRVGLRFARTHPNTLIVITADHAHTSQIVPVPSIGDATRPGALSTLLTKGDNSLMTINYATRPQHVAGSHGLAGSDRRTGSAGRECRPGPGAGMKPAVQWGQTQV